MVGVCVLLNFFARMGARNGGELSDPELDGISRMFKWTCVSGRLVVGRVLAKSRKLELTRKDVNTIQIKLVSGRQLSLPIFRNIFHVTIQTQLMFTRFGHRWHSTYLGIFEFLLIFRHRFGWR